MIEKKVKQSIVLDKTIPQYVREEYPQFVTFVRSYYKWLEQDNNTNDLLDKIMANKDISSVSHDDYKFYILDTFLNNIPKNLNINYATLIQNIKRFYSEKGTEESIRSFFYLLSESKKTHRITISYSGDEDLLLGQTIKGSNSGAIATILRASRVSDTSNYVVLIIDYLEDGTRYNNRFFTSSDYIIFDSMSISIKNEIEDYNITFFYPKEYLIRASDGVYKRIYKCRIKVEENTSINFVNNTFTSSSGSVGCVDKQSYRLLRRNGYDYYELNLNFQHMIPWATNETIIINGTLVELCDVYTSYTIETEGRGYEIGEVFNILDYSNSISGVVSISSVYPCEINYIVINSGGSNYSLYERFRFSYSDGIYGSGYVRSLSNGVITDLKIESYRLGTKEIPSIVFDSGNDTASLYVNGKHITGIKSINIEDVGFDVSPAYVDTRDTYPYNKSVIKMDVGRLYTTPYFFEDERGNPSSPYRLQDNHYWQDFSYEINYNRSTNLDVIEHLFKKTVHPAGLKYFFKYVNSSPYPSVNFSNIISNIKRDIMFFDYMPYVTLDYYGDRVIDSLSNIKDTNPFYTIMQAYVTIEGGTSSCNLITQEEDDLYDQENGLLVDSSCWIEPEVFSLISYTLDHLITSNGDLLLDYTQASGYQPNYAEITLELISGELVIVNNNDTELLLTWEDTTTQTISANTTLNIAILNDRTLTIRDDSEYNSDIAKGYRFSGSSIIRCTSWVGALKYFNFSNCINLISVPSTLNPNIINLDSFFLGCTSFNQALNTWNTINITSLANTFNGCSSFNQALNLWNTENVTSLESTFRDCVDFNQNINTWNVANVTTLQETFYGCSIYNQPLNFWNVSNVISLESAFYGCSTFDQDIGDWNVGLVTSLANTFNGCSSFNQALNLWNTENVTSLESTFKDCISFNQPLNLWNTENVTTAHETFFGCTAFNSNISDWDLSITLTTQGMFYNCSSFNQDISGWNVSANQDISRMFYNCSSFNQDISGWNVANVTTLQETFYGCSIYNQPLNVWEIDNVTNLASTFYGCILFNQPLNSWNTAANTTLSNTFNGCSSFNQDISDWNVANVTTLYRVFYNCSSFNQDISSWNVSSVSIFDGAFSFASVFNQSINAWNTISATSMIETFRGASVFNQPLNNWQTGSVTTMNGMFWNALVFNQNISNWCVSLITTQPANFATNAPLISANRPIWGTCPI